jgi:hypothetical protein
MRVSILNGVFVATASAANGRGSKKDNTKQSTLFGLPAVPAPEKTAKRARNKGGAVPSEDVRSTEPDTSESQDIDMVESQNTGDLASGSTVVDSQQESQATEVVTQVEVRFFPVLRLEIIQTTRRKETVRNLLTGLKRHPRWDKIFQMRYLPADADCIYTALLHSVMFQTASTFLLCIYIQIWIGTNRVSNPDRRLRKSLCSSPVNKLVDDLVR